MLYQDIKIGQNYQVESLGQIVEVKITGKKRAQDFYRVEYEYLNGYQPFGCVKGWSFVKRGTQPLDFPKIFKKL